MCVWKLVGANGFTRRLYTHSEPHVIITKESTEETKAEGGWVTRKEPR